MLRRKVNDPYCLSLFYFGLIILMDIHQFVAFVKSPYNTPIVNDSELIPSLSVLHKFKNASGKRTTNNQQEDNVESESDPFQTFLSSDMVIRIQKCWKLILKVHDGTISFKHQSRCVYSLLTSLNLL